MHTLILPLDSEDTERLMSSLDDAEAAGALTLIGAAHFGIPVSTTHTITGAIIDVGSPCAGSVRAFERARRIIWAWILTIPAPAAMAMICSLLIDYAPKLFWFRMVR